MLNVLNKLNNLRSVAHSSNLVKTGRNPHTKSSFWELDTLVPVVMRFNFENNTSTIFTIEDDVASLTFYDLESGEKLVFSNPFHLSTTQKDPAVGLGSSSTYIKRYLYVNLLEMTEDSEIDQHDHNAINGRGQSNRPQQNNQQQAPQRQMTTNNGNGQRVQQQAPTRQPQQVQSQQPQANNDVGYQGNPENPQEIMEYVKSQIHQGNVGKKIEVGEVEFWINTDRSDATKLYAALDKKVEYLLDYGFEKYLRN